MVRLNRRTITQEDWDAYNRFIDNDPSDNDIAQFICEQFPRLNPNPNQIFQIFQMLADRVPEFENHENIAQFQNPPRNLIENRRRYNLRPQPRPVTNQIQNQNMAAAQFVDDPFKGNINPGTAEGAKLYLKATASIAEDDKFEINITSAQKFVDVVTKDANTFGWGALVRAIPSDANGETKNILVDHRDITFEMIKKQAFKTWGNNQADFNTPVPDAQNLEVLDPAANAAHQDTLYRRVRSRMIAKQIIGYLKLSNWENLKNKSSKYTWTGQGDEEIDGPAILWILMQTCNPSTRVGVSELKEELRSANSAKFGHDIQKLTDFMSSKYREIKEKGQTHEDMILDVFNAFKTVPNPDFAAHVRDERKNWELGGDKDVDQIMSEALIIYNNAITANRWRTSDPKDAKILALTTQVEKLVEMQSQLVANATQAPSQNRTMNPRFQFTEIAAWRMKKGPEKLDRDGKTWFWCPHHKMEGQYDGLYVTHRPEEHDVWLKRKNERLTRRRRAKENQNDSEHGKQPGEDGSKKLVISDSLKSALMTHMDVSPEQIDALVKEAEGSSDF